MNSNIAKQLISLFDVISNEEAKNIKKMGLEELTLNEIRVLNKLREIEFEYGEITSKLIIKKLKLTKGTVSIVINRLILKNFLEKENKKKDKRQINFFLKNKALYALKIYDSWEKEILETALNNVSKEEIIILEKVLLNITKNLIEER